jgi:hypothetical protein
MQHLMRSHSFTTLKVFFSCVHLHIVSFLHIVYHLVHSYDAQLLDVVLIATQLVGPADGTAYRVGYYGPRVHVRFANSSSIAASGEL